jgi:hypothetical protein
LNLRSSAVEQVLLLTIVAVATLTALAGFVIGDRRRRAASGHHGPRARRSIGEAIELAGSRHGRVLVLFFAKDEGSMEAGAALADDEGVVALLSRPDLFHAVIRDGVEGPEIAATLFEKYAKAALPEGAVALLLDKTGLLIESKTVNEEGPLAGWLPDWVVGCPDEGRPVAEEEAGDAEGP